MVRNRSSHFAVLLAVIVLAAPAIAQEELKPGLQSFIGKNLWRLDTGASTTAI